MEFTLEYLEENLIYEAVIEGINFRGTIDYVSSHLYDGICTSFSISDNQTRILAPFVEKYLDAVKNGEKITVKEFYRKAI